MGVEAIQNEHLEGFIAIIANKRSACSFMFQASSYSHIYVPLYSELVRTTHQVKLAKVSFWVIEVSEDKSPANQKAPKKHRGHLSARKNEWAFGRQNEVVG